jgi:hypothetical protein
MGVSRHVLNPAEADLSYLPVITLGKKQRGRCVITSDEFYEVDVHWIGGRTLPCLETNCEACKAQRPRKYEAYLGIVWSTSLKHEILRLTKGAMFQLKSQLSCSGSPRGHVLSVERKGDRPNGRVTILVEPLQVEISRLPASPDLEAHLARIWRVDGIEVTKEEGEYIRRLSAFTEETIEKGRANHAS